MAKHAPYPQTPFYDRLTELSKLKEGWLDGHGKALTREALKQASAFGPSLPSDISLHVYPTEEGGVSLEWRDQHGSHEILVLPDGRLSLLTVEDEVAGASPPVVGGSARHREEVDAVNEVLRSYGISYPLGARGVRELAAQARHFRKKARGLEEDCARLEEEKAVREERLAGAHQATIGELHAAQARLRVSEQEVAAAREEASRGEPQPARGQVARVRALHQQYRFAGDDSTDYCAHCNQISGGWVPWPCPTVQALSGDR
jgi:hypothetical protein